MKIFIKTFVYLIVLIPLKAYPQACCTGGAPLSSSLGIISYTGENLVIDFSYDFNTMKDLYAGTTQLNDKQRERSTNSTILRFSYALNNKWAITTVLPYVWQEQTVRSNVGKTVQSSSGIGDIVLLGQYALMQNKKNLVLLAMGPKFPTGSISKTDNEFGLLLPPDLQPGTGSWDGIGAVSYSRYGIFRPTLSLYTLFSYRYSFQVGRYDGQQKYRFGNEMVINIGLTDSFLLKKWILNPGLQFKYRNTQKDENNGSSFPNTGGSWMYLVPSLDIELTPKIYLHSNFEIPIHTDVVGTQLVTSFKGNIGINYTLNFKKNRAYKIKD